MSHETERLEEQLRRATAAGPEPDPSADAETMALRETWIALGRLLEAATPVDHDVPEVRCPPRQTLRRRWSATVAATAACLLVGATVAWLAARSAPERAPSEVASQPLPSPAATSPEAPVGAGLEWDDSLDEEIVSANQQIWEIAQEPYRLRTVDNPIAERLKEMDQDLTENTL